MDAVNQKKLCINESTIAQVIKVLGQLPTEQVGQLYFTLLNEVQPQLQQDNTSKVCCNDKPRPKPKTRSTAKK